MAALVHVRRLVPADAGACAAVDDRSFTLEFARNADDIGAFLAQPCQGGYGAIWQGRLIACLLYHADRQGRRLYLMHIAVVPPWRRRHVATLLVQHVRRWLRPVPDVKLQAVVSERELPLQCFLRANGFQAIEIGRGWYDDGASDGYRFELVVDARLLPLRKACS